MPAINIVLDVFLVTYCVPAGGNTVAQPITDAQCERGSGVRKLAPGMTKDAVKKMIAGASAIWSSAGISFSLGTVTEKSLVLREDEGGASYTYPDALSSPSFMALSSKLPTSGARRINLFLVKEYQGKEGVGGKPSHAGSSRQLKAAIMSYLGRDASRDHTLAHELGHLLKLGHSGNTLNLMYVPYLNGDMGPQNALLPDQVTQAKDSPLARGEETLD